LDLQMASLHIAGNRIDLTEEASNYTSCIFTQFWSRRHKPSLSL